MSRSHSGAIVLLLVVVGSDARATPPRFNHRLTGILGLSNREALLFSRTIRCGHEDEPGAAILATTDAGRHWTQEWSSKAPVLFEFGYQKNGRAYLVGTESNEGPAYDPLLLVRLADGKWERASRMLTGPAKVERVTFAKGQVVAVITAVDQRTEDWTGPKVVVKGDGSKRWQRLKDANVEGQDFAAIGNSSNGWNIVGDDSGGYVVRLEAGGDRAVKQFAWSMCPPETGSRNKR